MRIHAMIQAMLAIAFLSEFVFAQPQTQPHTASDNPIAKLSPAERSQLEELIAQEIIDEKVKESSPALLSPEGSVIAHVKMEFVAANDKPFRVWKYIDTKLVPGNDADFSWSVGSEKTDWPPFLFLFSVRTIDSTSAVVEVRTVYSMGKAQNGRGGNQADWELSKIQGKWTVAKKTTILFWD